MYRASLIGPSAPTAGKTKVGPCTPRPEMNGPAPSKASRRRLRQPSANLIWTNAGTTGTGVTASGISRGGFHWPDDAAPHQRRAPERQPFQPRSGGGRRNLRISLECSTIHRAVRLETVRAAAARGRRYRRHRAEGAQTSASTGTPGTNCWRGRICIARSATGSASVRFPSEGLTPVSGGDQSTRRWSVRQRRHSQSPRIVTASPPSYTDEQRPPGGATNAVTAAGFSVVVPADLATAAQANGAA